MRRWAVALAVLASLVFTSACGRQISLPRPLRAPLRVETLLAPVVGQTIVTTPGAWGGNPTRFTYQWEDCDASGNNCVNIGGATSSSYTVQQSDVGDTLRTVVVAYNGQGSASQTSAQTGVIAGSTATVVGTAAVPTVSCSATISTAGGNTSSTIQNALSGKAAGWVLCLNNGSWVAQTITGLTPVAPGYTVVSAPGQTAVNMAGLTTTNTTNNLTVEGINYTSGFHVHAAGNTIAVKYNNFENFTDYAVEGAPAVHVSTDDLSNFDVEYNQIDHTSYCLRFAANSASNWTFSHNVCGPGQGNASSVALRADSHYTQTECLDTGLTMNNNAFVGPYDATTLAQSSPNNPHNNISHACGTSLTFDNNIVWHGQSIAQSVLWGDDGNVTTAEANNNLFVEDATCVPTCSTVAMWLDGSGSGHADSNVTFSNNTIKANTGSSSGGMWTRSAGITNFTAQNNIAVNNTGGDGDFSLGTCTTCSANVADDGSGNVTWTPNWQDTTWTPTNGSPWSPPPSDFYKPVLGLGVTSAMGYQGTIGP